MDLYALLKLVHIAAAIFWVGGASLMTVLVLLLTARGDDRGSLAQMRQLGMIGQKVFLPTGLLTIVTGLLIAWLGEWNFAAWTVLSFAIVVGTFTMGGAVLGPSLERTIVLDDQGKSEEALALGRRVVRLVKLDLGGQWAIIALMVLKPGWTDPGLLVPAAILAGGAVAYLLGAPRLAAVRPA